MATGFEGSHTNPDSTLESGEGEPLPSGEGALAVARGSSRGGWLEGHGLEKAVAAGPVT